ncbi:MAG TPA: TadE/TadG family type IV pilus assembly protein [Sphingobium sp.]
MILRRLSELRQDHRGLALMEFAVLLPVMLILFLGGYQLSQASVCKRRVTIVTRAIADLVSRYETMTPADVDFVLDASEQIMAPYNVTATQERVSLIKVDSTRKVTVVWSKGRRITARTVGTFSGLPSSMAIADSYYIFAEVVYDYHPMDGVFSYPLTLTQSLFMVPRKSDFVDCPTC